MSNILNVVNESMTKIFLKEDVVKKEEVIETDIPISENIIDVISIELASRQYLRGG